MKTPRKKVGSVAQHPDAILKAIGKSLKERRKALGYSNGDDFAYDTGINRSQYGKYEAGSQDMRLSILLKTVNSMGITIQEFFDGLE